MNVWLNYKFQILLVVYTLDVLSLHQWNILYLILSRDIKYYTSYFILRSNIPMLSHNRFKFLHKNSWVASYLFPRSVKVLPNWKRPGVVKVSDSLFSMWDSFEHILDDIPCVNSLLKFISDLNFELKITNHHCAPSI